LADGRKTSNENNVNTWFLQPYASQLANLEILDDTPPPLKAPMKNLLQIKVNQIQRNFITESGPAPVLKRLSIGCGLWQNVDFNFLEMMNYIDKFSSSLVHLHLDINWFDLTVGKEAKNQENWDVGSHQLALNRDRDPIRMQLANGHLPTAKSIFPNLKSLLISFPREKIDLALLKTTVLVKFPMLETLIFSNFGLTPFDISHYSLVHAVLNLNIVEKVLREQNYWETCPRLKTITVVRRTSYSDPDEIVAQLSR